MDDEAKLKGLREKVDKDLDELDNMKFLATDLLQNLLTQMLRLAHTPLVGSSENKPIRDSLTNFNTKYPQYWEDFVNANEEIAQLNVNQMGELFKKTSELKKQNLNKLDTEIDKKNKEIQDLTAAKDAEIHALREENNKLSARLKQGEGLAAEAEQKLKVTLLKKPTPRGQKHYDITETVDEAIKLDNRISDFTRFDFGDDDLANERYIGYDGRVYNKNNTLYRNGGTRRKRQRRGRKSRR
jgi:hypothetical protein